MLTIHIVSDPVHSYKLIGDHLNDYHEKALEDARDLYLDFYDEVYQNVITKDFNPLWTPDTKSDNEIDFKDDFWGVSYFLFNACLLKNLKREYDVKVIDETKSQFPIQKYLYQFLDQEKIAFEKPYKEDRLINKNAIKKFVLQSLRNLPENIRNIPHEIRKRFLLKKQNLSLQTGDKKTLYLFVEPVDDMDFVDWRYSKVLEEYGEKADEIVLLSTIDFKNSEEQDIPFINVNRLLSIWDLICVFFKSFFLNIRIRGYVFKSRLKHEGSVEFKYFLKNAPVNLFYPIRENVGFNNLFKKKGLGLLIIKGPVMNKSGAMQIYNARKYGIRTLIIASRILTSTRLSNQFVPSHFNDQYSAVLPYAMTVDDQISYETLQKQMYAIDIYPLRKKYDLKEVESVKLRTPFRITLALQKKKEIEAMAGEVIAAVEHLDDVVLDLKMHPLFPMYDQLVKRYQQIPFVNILPIDTSLSKAIDHSDLCVTAYSTAALEFAMKGKPIIWMKNVTFNRLFFADLQKKIGITTNNSEDLCKAIKQMRDDEEFYNTLRMDQHSQLKEIIYTSNSESYSLNEIIDKELAKV